MGLHPNEITQALRGDPPKRSRDGLTKYHTWLFIGGAQVGDNNTFADWHKDDEEALADSRAYFEGQGYYVSRLEIIPEGVLYPPHPPFWKEPITGRVILTHLQVKK